jgi:uncharacterized membrane protein
LVNVPDLPAGGVEARAGIPARLRVAVAALAGICAAVLIGFLGPVEFALLGGWDVAAVLYVAWMWITIWHLDPEHTARQAVREDPGRAATDALVLVASLASLLAVGLVLVRAAHTGGAGRTIRAALGVASVGFSWSVVHTLFTLRYARLYYTGPDGGVDFHQKERPRFSDFAYLSFTIGMTFQVSDTDLTDNRIRATALVHALLSYLFGVVIIATMINLVAGLTSS